MSVCVTIRIIFTWAVTEMINLYLSVLETDEDRCQFEDIYRQYKNRMYKFAISILHNNEDAEDVVQQSFLTIANNFDKIKSFSCHEMNSYIVIIVRNTSINLYNKNKRNSERSTELNQEQTAVEVDFFNNIDYEHLVQIISGLPLIYKEILLLRYVEEFTVKQISAMLGISIDNVRKRTERAKKLLKAELESGEQNGE